jgi:hypothetical protein
MNISEQAVLADKVYERFLVVLQRVQATTTKPRWHYTAPMLVAAIDHPEVDLKVLLEFKHDADLVHDVLGIAKHWNCYTHSFSDFFLPRCWREVQQEVEA